MSEEGFSNGKEALASSPRRLEQEKPVMFETESPTCLCFHKVNNKKAKHLEILAGGIMHMRARQDVG